MSATPNYTRGSNFNATITAMLIARIVSNDHCAGEYSRGSVHVNTAEGFFSQLKRSLDGTHHHVSERHLTHYSAEFDYRYNSRMIKDGERVEMAIGKARGRRLMYRQTTTTPVQDPRSSQ